MHYIPETGWRDKVETVKSGVHTIDIMPEGSESVKSEEHTVGIAPDGEHVVRNVAIDNLRTVDGHRTVEGNSEEE